MNREILFRGFSPCENGKDKVFVCIDGEWVEGYLLRLGGKSYISHISTTEQDIELMRCWNEVIPETVGQYTGLTDKNGKKIFDDDYCLVIKPCVMAWGAIKYKNACYWFIENKVQADGTHNMIRLCDLESNGYEIKVKGNIHDNPELLEVSEH